MPPAGPVHEQDDLAVVLVDVGDDLFNENPNHSLLRLYFDRAVARESAGVAWADQGGRGFRRFLLRGLVKVRSEWALIALTHNARAPSFEKGFSSSFISAPMPAGRFFSMLHERTLPPWAASDGGFDFSMFPTTCVTESASGGDFRRTLERRYEPWNRAHAITVIAQAVHESIRAYQAALGERASPPWEQAGEMQQWSRDAVEFALSDPRPGRSTRNGSPRSGETDGHSAQPRIWQRRPIRASCHSTSFPSRRKPRTPC